MLQTGAGHGRCGALKGSLAIYPPAKFDRAAAGLLQPTYLRLAKGPSAKDTGQIESLCARAVERLGITCVGVAHDAGGGVVPQHAL